MDTYQKKSVFSAPSRKHFHRVYFKITQYDYVHTLREAPADSRGASVTLKKKLKCCVLSLYSYSFMLSFV